MNYTKSVARIFLGLLLLWPFIHILIYLKEFPILNQIPIRIYLLGNTLILFLVGLLIIFNVSFGVVFQIIGSVMAGLTFDNPMLTDYPQEKLTRLLYLACQIIIIMTLIALKEDQIAQVKFAKANTLSHPT